MKNVYFDHDGNVDDLVSLLLLLQVPDIRLLGVGVVDADGYQEPAVAASRKIIDHFNTHHQDLSVAASDSRPVNQFPKEWRLISYSFNAMPLLNRRATLTTPLAPVPAHQDMVAKIRQADGPTTVVMTGPLTDLARALTVAPDIAAKIERVFWMGGTMNNQDNVNEPGRDGMAEWNAYWDPQAVHTVFHAGVPLQMIGLESTDELPLTDELRQHWNQMVGYPAVDLIGQGYALVLSYEANSTYYLWDVLTAMASQYPELVTTQAIEGDVLTTGPAAGRTFRQPAGQPLTLVTRADKAAFFATVDRLAQSATYQP
ncbi:nucleoside hydrolase [Levilactobacillus spicheri]